jgi:uncharacterized protein YdaU (DUF1376 family)
VVKIAAISIADYCEATEGMPYDVERLYFRMILKMLAREGALPDDDADNARIFGYDRRVYARLKAKLLAWSNAIYVEDGLLKNARVEDDIKAYQVRRGEAVENGRKGGLAKAEVSRKSEESPAEVCEKSPRISHATHNEINDVAVASPSPTPTPKEPTTSVVPEAARGCAAKIDLDELEGKLRGACNGALANPAVAQGLFDLSIPLMWLNQGCDLDLDVLPTLRGIGKREHGKNIGSWGYFTKPVTEAKRRRESGLPAVDVPKPAEQKPTVNAEEAEAKVIDMKRRIAALQRAAMEGAHV